MADPQPRDPANPPMRRPGRAIGGWKIWSLPEPLRSYLLLVMLAAAVAAAVVAARTGWRLTDLGDCLILVTGGIVAIEATRSIEYMNSGISRDLATVWYLAIAITLPPAYAMLAPVPLTAWRLWRAPIGLAYRRVFSNATMVLAYGAASALFRAFPSGFAGHMPGSGVHALTWSAAALAAGTAAWVINNGLLVPGIRLAYPRARLSEMFGYPEQVTADIIELGLAVFVAVVAAANPLLVVLAIPFLALYRRHLMQAQRLMAGRLDPSAGVLNATTWSREADVHCSRAAGQDKPIALLLIGIDQFAATVTGQDAAGQVLRGVAQVLHRALRGQGVVGRAGDDEFAVLLPVTGPAEARQLGWRVRDDVSAQPFAVDSPEHAGYVYRLTVSVGVAVARPPQTALPALLSSAEAALADARATGYNRVCVRALDGGGGTAGQVPGPAAADPDPDPDAHRERARPPAL